MALAPRDIPITRTDVQGWLDTWKKSRSKKKGTKEEYVRARIAELKLPDEMVDTSGHGSGIGDETHIADLLLRDLGSYRA